jgi:hypothetical protein
MYEQKINGHVVAADGEDGVPGVRVRLEGKDGGKYRSLDLEDETDERGRFSLPLNPREIKRKYNLDVHRIRLRVWRDVHELHTMEERRSWSIDKLPRDLTLHVKLEALLEEATVTGTVRQPDGEAEAQAVVRAFHEHLRGEQPLGNATTDDAGRYEIHYRNGGSGDAAKHATNLVVRAYRMTHGKETVLGESGVVFGAQPHEHLDITVGDAPFVGPSEYDRYVRAITPLLDGVSLAELKDDEEHDDIGFLAIARRRPAAGRGDRYCTRGGIRRGTSRPGCRAGPVPWAGSGGPPPGSDGRRGR